MVATAAAPRRGADRVPLPARRGRRAWRCRSEAEPLAIGKGRMVREGTRVALLSLRHAAGGVPEGSRRAGRARPVDHGGGRPLRQAARRGAGRAPRARARGAADDRGGRVGGFGSHVQRHLLEAGLLDEGGLRLRRGAAGPVHRPGHAGRPVRGGRPRRAAIAAAAVKALGGRPRSGWHGGGLDVGVDGPLTASPCRAGALAGQLTGAIHDATYDRRPRSGQDGLFAKDKFCLIRRGRLVLAQR